MLNSKYSTSMSEWKSEKFKNRFNSPKPSIISTKTTKKPSSNLEKTQTKQTLGLVMSKSPVSSENHTVEKRKLKYQSSTSALYKTPNLSIYLTSPQDSFKKHRYVHTQSVQEVFSPYHKGHG